MKQIYLDHAATTPMHPKVLQVMMEAYRDTFGNPSSIHSFGRKARKVLDKARQVLAKSIGAAEQEIIFTSGGTEADNYAILSIAKNYKDKGQHLITTEIEHHAVLHTFQELEKRGYEVTYLPVNEEGAVQLADVKAALRDDTILVSIMYGNNEVGTIQPIQEIGQLLASHQAKFHTDAVQAFSSEAIDVKQGNIDLLSVTAHKINGPKGIGFLYAKKDIKLSPLLFGGEQERKRRPGTENVGAIAGFMEAVKIVEEERDLFREKYKNLKKVLLDTLSDEKITYYLNGSLNNSLPHVVNISFPGANVEAILVNLDLAGIAVSSGSACTAGSVDPSHVLAAMYGKESERVRNSIRFSFGITNTAEEIVQAGKETAKIIRRLVKKER
ncbi:cysteine desulfurase [Bacillaceae bacterium Marseille-Q3522]|nr:cysteine desulfurase [Bacillaceae bacterium Marseille-Q3522]